MAGGAAAADVQQIGVLYEGVFDRLVEGESENVLGLDFSEHEILRNEMGCGV